VIAVIFLAAKVHRLNAQAAKNAGAAGALKAADGQTQSNPGKPDTPQSHAEQDKAKAALAQLQAQLDKAKSEQADLQAQLDKAKAESAGLQDQLGSSKAQSADLQTQLEKAKSETADLQGQLSQAASSSAQLQAQLDQERTRSAGLQSRLQKSEGELARLQPVILKARHMPVTASFERVRGGPFEGVSANHGFTLHIVNLYLEPLSVEITVTGPEKSRTQAETIEGGRTLNIMKLAAGDKVMIASEDYDPVNLTVQ